ncbi:hypothetical protein OJ997_02520 [Solirubrobacter phytolaccae]|uniref:Uncharacterized protein n=1 Tax=Solirubrobacter phytolaccae TaxID=1404360 RepID=A0A9X3N7J5_9ACTN|nr:hypothetical protein [Solirubrobacter phytolaccae]MDA0179156.1 hypothetical protein [Solirubrobacter phytolaccae]
MRTNHEIQSALEALVPTGVYDSGAGNEFVYPTRHDYVVALRRRGLVRCERDLVSDDELVVAVQAHWYSGGHSGCLFAGYLSETRPQHGWEAIDVDADGDVASLAAYVAARIRAPETDILSLIVPRADDAGFELASLVAALGAVEGWDLRVLGADQDADLGEIVRVSLRTAVALDHWSEILGFGRHPGQAPTRWSPFSELAIRAKEPARPDPDLRANMDDVPLTGVRPQVRAEWWRETKLSREARLGAEYDARGKARVTLAVPRATWREVTGE